MQKLIKDGGALPEGVHPFVYDNGANSTTEFYTVHAPELTEAEKQELLTFTKLSYLRTIKNCVVFFTVLTVLSLIATFFGVLSFM